MLCNNFKVHYFYFFHRRKPNVSLSSQVRKTNVNKTHLFLALSKRFLEALADLTQPWLAKLVNYITLLSKYNVIKLTNITEINHDWHQTPRKCQNCCQKYQMLSQTLQYDHAQKSAMSASLRLVPHYLAPLVLWGIASAIASSLSSCVGITVACSGEW